ncbi:MAG: hypothetical protein KDA24_02365 [Deltaproteobacteria bacterium]|nr:hypothetical protein [Deltaproteobacteria bacterium]
MSDAEPTRPTTPSPPAPPGVFEMLAGPFRGFSIYRRAADASRGLALVVLLLGLLLGAALVATVQMMSFSRTIDAMEDSAISFMPRVNIENGWATVEAAPGRLIETDRVVILFDTRPEPSAPPAATGEDQRPRVLVGDRALLLYTEDRSVPLALPWGQVTQALGPRVSVDGPELVSAFRRTMPRTVLTIGALITAGLLLWELVLIGVLVGLYRVLFGRRLGSPSPSRLFVVACLASLPATAVGVLVVVLLSRQETAVLVHGATLSGLMLVAGNSLVGLPVLRKADAGALDAPPPKAVATEL